MDAAHQLREDLPVAMTMAAFVGISWYICVELNIRLFFTFRRHSGLYFWSCLLCSWGVLVQPLATILTDFGVWTNKLAAMVVIYLSWFIMVIPQSFVLYSRLYLIISDPMHLSRILYTIVLVSVGFSLPTMVVGILAQTSMGATLGAPYLIWDKVQLTAFFLQETILSLLYIVETRRRLKSSSMLHHDRGNRDVFNHLIYVNVMVIFLDCSLLALSYASLFYIQSAYKPCVYGVKLRVEFAILNRLKVSVQRPSRTDYGCSSLCDTSISRHKREETRLENASRQSQSEAQMIHGSGRGQSDFDVEIARS